MARSWSSNQKLTAFPVGAALAALSGPEGGSKDAVSVWFLIGWEAARDPSGAASSIPEGVKGAGSAVFGEAEAASTLLLIFARSAAFLSFFGITGIF
jgi:hypothetical protein